MKLQRLFNAAFIMGLGFTGVFLPGGVCSAEGAVLEKPDIINVVVDGRNIDLDQPPVIKDQRVLVPLRGIFEAIGADIVWNQESQTVTGRKGYDVFSIGIGSTKAVANDREFNLEVPACIINNRTMVPVRFAAESVGADVQWDGDNKTVLISTASEEENQTVTAEGEIHMKSGEGSANGYITAGSSCRFEIDEDIDPEEIVILSLSNLDDNNKGKFNYITLYNRETGQNICYATGAAAEGGYAERSRIRYFRTSDFINKRYYVIVSTPDDGYTGKFTINAKVVNRISFVKEDTAENKLTMDANPSAPSTDPFSPDAPRTYCISSNPEKLGEKALDTQLYSNEGKGSELGESGYYLQRSPVNRNANIFWEHINNYGRDMKFGVLLWNTEKEPLTIKLNSRSFYGSELNGPDFSCSTRIWIERAEGKKSMEKDEADSYYSGFGPNYTITIPAYNEENPSDSARWICLYTVKDSKGGYFNGVEDISVTDSSGNEYTGQKLLCDTYIMEVGFKGCVPNHEMTRINVSHAQRAFGDRTYRGSGNGAVLEAHIQGTTFISDDHPFNFVIGGYDVPFLNDGELMALNDYIWNSDSNSPFDFVNYVEDYPKNGSSTITADDIRQINGRVNGGNYGVIYKLTFDRILSDKPVKGKIKFNSKVIGCFYDFNLSNGFPQALVAVYDDKGRNFEAALSRKGDMVSSCIEVDFNEDIAHDDGPVTFYFVMGGMGSMPVEISFENT